MGCGVSRVDGILIFRRVQEMRNQPLLTDSTHSKKELIISHENPPNVLQAVKPEDPMEKDIEGKNIRNDHEKHDGKCEKENEFDGAWTDEDDERMIGNRGDGNFPGSPSFRVYFKEEDDHEHDDIGKSDAFKDKALSEDDISSKEIKKVTSGRKRRSFRKVLPKGLKMKSRSIPENTHLLIDKNPSQN